VAASVTMAVLVGVNIGSISEVASRVWYLVDDCRLRAFFSRRPLAPVSSQSLSG